MTIPVITIIGKSGAGKTTLLEKLIAELTRRGYDVGTVKHHSHVGFEIDHPGKDSWRHARAGSRFVVVAAPDKIASYRLLERELALDEITAVISGVDIILAEGYRQAGKPTLEVVRAANSLELICPPEQRFAVAADVPLETGVPQFHLNDVQGMADLIEQLFLPGKAG
ncbi:MAG: molybdopterin-guanine dinucleotide biosynthesis protein B [Anaerolineae bacterium]|nr:molybdopterin-guanine dinucleotide biosynthesis protein B [Anaerolineae bacterium]